MTIAERIAIDKGEVLVGGAWLEYQGD